MDKTKGLLAYLIQNDPGVTITSLMKLSYLIDLVSIKKHDTQISNFIYKRYKYGPFDQNIHNYISSLINEGAIIEEPAYTPKGDEYITYKINDEFYLCVDKLEENDVGIADEVLESVRGYGAKALVDVSYKTKPMIKIGAKQDNDVGINEKLYLRAT